MAAGEIIGRIQGQQGWTDATVLSLLVDYIENQQSDDALEDFLQEAASIDDEE